MVYRYLLGSSFVILGSFTDATLFGPQPAITRVSKLVRAEALSLYYGQIHFVLDIELKTDRRRVKNPFKQLRKVSERDRCLGVFPGTTRMGYVDFCHTIEVVTSTQRQTPGYLDLLRYVRNLTIYITAGSIRTMFKKRGGANLATYHSGAECEINCADLKMVRPFVQKCMEGHMQLFLLDLEERFVNVLLLLGRHLRSE